MTQAALEQVRADDSKLAGEHLPPTNSATPPNRKNHRLTKKEMAAVRGIQREVAENEGIVLGWCFINAQRAAMCASMYGCELLYHEGFFHKPDERIKHAWNTLNGKLVDLSSPMPVEEVYRHPSFISAYETTGTYTGDQVGEAMLKSGGFYWFNDPDPTEVSMMP